jgi:hypothetical protein
MRGVSVVMETSGSKSTTMAKAWVRRRQDFLERRSIAVPFVIFFGRRRGTVL